MRNLIQNQHIGLIFLVPGWGEILRINGKAWIINDQNVLAPCAIGGVIPELGIGVEIEVAYVHCAKAFMRSGLWDPQRWPPIDDIPSLATILHAHTHGKLGGQKELAAFIDESYATKTHLPS